MEKEVCSALKLSAKGMFLLDKFRLIRNMGLKLCFAIQHIGNRKKFLKCFLPHNQANPFAYNCSFTIDIVNSTLS